MGGLACRSAGKRFDAAHDSGKGRLPDTLLRESHHRTAAEIPRRAGHPPAGGDAYDNAPVESVISTIKNELVNRSRFKTRDQARLAVFDYIETFYNPRRLHSSLGHRSPNEYERIRRDQETAAAA
jgi:transposase InsO family protein